MQATSTKPELVSYSVVLQLFLAFKTLELFPGHVLLLFAIFKKAQSVFNVREVAHISTTLAFRAECFLSFTANFRSFFSVFSDVATITDCEEYFFKSRDRDAIADNSKLRQSLIKLMEEALKLTRILHRYLESDLPRNLTQLPHILAQVVA